jgi:hypothetical protein
MLVFTFWLDLTVMQAVRIYFHINSVPFLLNHSCIRSYILPSSRLLIGLLVRSLIYSSIHLSAIPFSYLFVFFNSALHSIAIIISFPLFHPADLLFVTSSLIFSSVHLLFPISRFQRERVPLSHRPFQDFRHEWEFSGVNAVVCVGYIDAAETLYAWWAHWSTCDTSSRHFSCCISLVRHRFPSFHAANRNNADTT